MHENGDLSWNGLANGYRAFVDYDAASGVSVVVASNLTSGALDKIRSALPKIAAGEDVPTPEPIKAKAADVDTGFSRAIRAPTSCGRGGTSSSASSTAA